MGFETIDDRGRSFVRRFENLARDRFGVVAGIGRSREGEESGTGWSAGQRARVGSRKGQPSVTGVAYVAVDPVRWSRSWSRSVSRSRGGGRSADEEEDEDEKEEEEERAAGGAARGTKEDQEAYRRTRR